MHSTVEPPTPYYSEEGITIYCGDCRQIVPTLGKFDLMLTDPPYGIAKWNANSTGGFMSKKEASKMTWDGQTPEDWVLKMLLSSSESSIIWGGNYMPLPPASRVLIWDKENRGMHFAEAEVAWTNLEHGTTRMLTLGIKSTEVFGTKSERQHPTQKPTGVISWCINQVPDAKTVLDPYMGSGTTLVAAKLRGLKATGIEINEEYCDIAKRRLAQGVLSL